MSNTTTFCTGHVIDDRPSAFHVRMAKALPWLTSACAHALAFLVLALVVTAGPTVARKIEAAFVPGTPPAVAVPPPPTRFDNDRPRMGPLDRKPVPDKSSTPIRRRGGVPGAPDPSGILGRRMPWSPEKPEPAGKGSGWSRRSGVTNVYGAGSGAGQGVNGSADWGLGGGGGNNSPDFFGPDPGPEPILPGNVRHVIYVIDCSGSVLPAFEEIVNELIASIGSLSEDQHFHVIFFARDSSFESPARRLVQATGANRTEVLQFFRTVRPAGWGSSPIPAIQAALRAFKDVPNVKGEHKLMYILTDGDFDTSELTYKGLKGNEAVIRFLRDANDGSVSVFPITLGPRPSPETVASMETIARDNHGLYTAVERK